MKKKDLLAMAAGAYPGAFPATRKQAKKHEVGDTLADFIYLELDETQEDEVDFDEAIRVLQTAIDDINEVLESVKVAAGRKEPK